MKFYILSVFDPGTLIQSPDQHKLDILNVSLSKLNSTISYNKTSSSFVEIWMKIPSVWEALTSIIRSSFSILFSALAIPSSLLQTYSLIGCTLVKSLYVLTILIYNLIPDATATIIWSFILSNIMFMLSISSSQGG